MKIFRRFRESVLPGSGARKYLLYAIGEIILVVVGILIALWINSIKTDKAYETSETQLLKDITAQLLKDRADVMRFQEDVEKRNRSYMYFSNKKKKSSRITAPLLYELDLSKLRIDPVVISSIENFEFRRGEISFKCTEILSDYKYAQNRINQLESDMQHMTTEFTSYLGKKYEWHTDYSFENHIVSEATAYFLKSPEYRQFIASLNAVSAKQYATELDLYRKRIGVHIEELQGLLK